MLLLITRSWAPLSVLRLSRTWLPAATSVHGVYKAKVCVQFKDWSQETPRVAGTARVSSVLSPHHQTSSSSPPRSRRAAPAGAGAVRTGLAGCPQQPSAAPG